MKSSTNSFVVFTVSIVSVLKATDAFAPNAVQARQRKTQLGYIVDTEVEVGTSVPNINMKIGPLERIYPKGEQDFEIRNEKDPNMMAQGLADLAFQAELERARNGTNKLHQEQIERDMAMVRAHIEQKRREMREAEEIAKAEAAWLEENPTPEAVTERTRSFRGKVISLAKKRSTLFSALILVAVKRIFLMWIGVGLSPF